MITEIAFTAYRVTDMARARGFYEGVLGLKVETNYGDQWIEYGIGGGTFVIQTYSPEPPTGKRGAVAFEVDDIETTIAGLKAAGMPFTLELTESPMCHFAAIDDPDGNSLMIHQRKKA